MNMGSKCLKANLRDLSSLLKDHAVHPKRMDTEFPLIREAHERNDKILDRIYIDRRFTENILRSDTERLEKLFELYTKMTDKKTQLKQDHAKRHY